MAKTVHCIESEQDYWASTNKKRMFKSWINDVIRELEDDSSNQRVIEELERYKKNFCNKVSGRTHYENLKKLMEVYGMFDYEDNKYIRNYEEWKI